MKINEMKVVILAGGLGTRLSEETTIKPKPMVEIGDKPIIWHIMKFYSHYGFNDFIVCAGYKQNIIKEWFANYYLHNSDITFDFLEKNKTTVHNSDSEPWKVTIVDTGLDTMTGGRIKKIKKYIGDEQFLLTYGDGVCDVDVLGLINFHNKQKKAVTITAVNIPQRFGILEMDDRGNVKSFREKDGLDGSLINGGFMVCEPEIFDYIKNDKTVLEKDVLPKLAKDGKLNAFKHYGFWQCMDSKREKDRLENMWEKNKAPWKIWK